MEKMTNPANMLVHELMQQTMMESLERGRGGVREGGAVRKAELVGRGYPGAGLGGGYLGGYLQVRVAPEA